MRLGDALSQWLCAFVNLAAIATMSSDMLTLLSTPYAENFSELKAENACFCSEGL
tara:strand:- start:125 stop:289 length:165 start_codon:yes stop_codon:yes gene_type:complete